MDAWNSKEVTVLEKLTDELFTADSTPNIGKDHEKPLV
jgi:hypothetical protein